LLVAQKLAFGKKSCRCKADRFANDINSFIWQATMVGKTSLRKFAAVLNEHGLTTPRGGQWSAVQVQRVQNQATGGSPDRQGLESSACL
jgi:hypothetical protein